jgi:hypothetical protein
MSEHREDQNGRSPRGYGRLTDPEWVDESNGRVALIASSYVVCPSFGLAMYRQAWPSQCWIKAQSGPQAVFR